MEITLEKIELVKDRTGASYKEAKAALEKTEGNVVDAIILIEENIDIQPETKAEKSVSRIVQDVKDVVNKGNVTKILIKKDEEVILNIPVNVGILGVILVPWVSVISAVTALGFKCSISVVKNNGDVVDIVEKATEKFGGVKENCSEIYDELKEKGGEAVSKVKQKAESVKSRVKSEDEDSEDYDDDYFNFDDEYPDIDECGSCEEGSGGDTAFPSDELKIFDIVEEEAEAVEEKAAEEIEDMFKLFDTAEENAEASGLSDDVEEPDSVEEVSEMPEEEYAPAEEEVAQVEEAAPAEDEEAAPIEESAEELFDAAAADDDKNEEAVSNDSDDDLESLIDELIEDGDESFSDYEEEPDDLKRLLDEIEKYGAEAEDVMKEAEDAIEDTDMMSDVYEESVEDLINENGRRKRRFRLFR